MNVNIKFSLIVYFITYIDRKRNKISNLEVICWEHSTVVLAHVFDLVIDAGDTAACSGSD